MRKVSSMMSPLPCEDREENKDSLEPAGYDQTEITHPIDHERFAASCSSMEGIICGAGGLEGLHHFLILCSSLPLFLAGCQIALSAGSDDERERERVLKHFWLKQHLWWNTVTEPKTFSWHTDHIHTFVNYWGRTDYICYRKLSSPVSFTQQCCITC